jgi:hypothetical protein
MLSDSYAAEEVRRLLAQYYGGEVGKLQYINYDPASLVRPFFRAPGGIRTDHIDEFQQFIDYGATGKKEGSSGPRTPAADLNEYIRSQMEFDEIMQVSSNEFFSEKAEREYTDKLEREELLSQSKLDE